MQTNIKANNPKQIEFTLTVTMPLSQWLELREQLSEKWPSWELSSAINNMLSQAEKVYFPKDAN